MSIGSRIRELRKTQKKAPSQEAFGKALGVSRDVVSNLELERVEVPESMIRLICSTFDVNYHWLKDGQGEMYLPPDTEDEMVDAVMAGENEFAKSVFRSFAKLGDEEWLLLKRMVDLISGKD